MAIGPSTILRTERQGDNQCPSSLTIPLSRHNAFAGSPEPGSPEPVVKAQTPGQKSAAGVISDKAVCGG